MRRHFKTVQRGVDKGVEKEDVGKKDDEVSVGSVTVPIFFAPTTVLTFQSDFEATLRLAGQMPLTLDELNARFWDCLQTVCHSRMHEGIGMTPNERFAQGSRQVRPLDPTLDLDWKPGAWVRSTTQRR